MRKILISLIIPSFALANASNTQERVKSVTSTLSKNARDFFLNEVYKSGSQQVPYQKVEYGNETFNKLKEIKKKLNKSDRHSVSANQFMSKSIDYVINPMVDTISSFAYAAGPQFGIAAQLAGTVITGSFGMISNEAKAQVTKYENKLQDLITSTIGNVLLQDDQLVQDLANISAITDSKTRNEELNKYVENIRKVHIDKFLEADQDGNTTIDVERAKIETNTIMVKALTKEVFHNKQLINQNTETLKAHFQKISANSTNITKNAKNIAKLGQTITVMNAKYEKAFQGVYDYQMRFQSAVEQSFKTLNGNITNLMMREFNQMSPAQKLKSIKSDGLLANILNEKQKKEIKEQFEPLANLDEFIKDAKTIAFGVQTFVNIGSNLGVDPKLLNDLNEVARLVDPTTQLITGLASTPYNPIAIMSGLSGLFGGSKTDAAAKRHKQIMQSLQQITKMLSAVLKNQETIKEDLNKIKRMQVEIYNSVQNLHSQFGQIEQIALSINREVLFNRELLNIIIRKDFDPCLDILGTVADDRAEYCDYNYTEEDPYCENSKVFDYTYFDNLVFSEQELFEQCFNTYSSFYNFKADKRTFAVKMSLRANSGDTGSISKSATNYLTKVYEPILKLHKEVFANYTDSLFATLAHPITSFDKIEKRNQAFFSAPDRATKDFYFFLNTKFSNDISSEHINNLLQLMPLFELEADLNAEEFYNKKPNFRHKKIKRMLQRAYRAALIPLAQENMLSGELLLSETKTLKQRDLTDILSNNKIFAKNFINYEINQELIRKNLKPSNLLIKMSLKDHDAVNNMIGDIGFGLTLKSRNFNEKKDLINKKISSIKYRVDQFKREQLSQEVRNYISRLNQDGIIIDLEEIENGITDFYETITTLENQLKKYTTDFNQLLDEQMITAIEHAAKNSSLSKIGLSPFDHTQRYNLVNTIHNIFLNAQKDIFEIKNLIRNKNNYWFEDKKGNIYSIPRPKEILAKKVFRTKDFFQALEDVNKMKGLYLDYFYNTETYNKRNMSDLRSLLIK